MDFEAGILGDSKTGGSSVENKDNLKVLAEYFAQPYEEEEEALLAMKIHEGLETRIPGIP